MSEEINKSLKDELFASLHGLRDYYQDFDVCTWAFVDDADEASAIVECIREYPEAATGITTNLNREPLEAQARFSRHFPLLGSWPPHMRR